MKALSLPSVNGSTLKIMACVAMFIDHTGAALIRPLSYALPESARSCRQFLDALYPVMRGVGRIAFPIFCFLLVEGFRHTKDARKYAGRLFIFALISELPFDFALANNLFSRQHQNVYFTLLIGLLVMMGVSELERWPVKTALQRYVVFFAEAAVAVGGLYLARALYTDYGFKGVFLIEVLYFTRLDRHVQAIMGALAISWETWGPLGFLPVWFYDGTRGKQLKYFFYWFYPAHLLLLGFLKYAITGRLQF